MKILVTGGAGFVGLNVAEALLSAGHDVVVFGNQEVPNEARQSFARLPGRLEAVRGDIRDAAAVERVVGEYSVERIVHGAIVTAGETRERAAAALIMDVNLLGPVHVAEAARRHRVDRLLMISSTAVYGRGAATARELTEEAAQQPETLYSITKACTEQVLTRLAALHGVNLVIGRLGWVFGPWERDTGWRDTLSPIYQATDHARSGRAVRLARPDRRDVIYGRDAAAALTTLLFADHPRFSVYNLGAAQSWSLADWCARLAERFPAFAFSVGKGGPGVPIEHYSEVDAAPLSNARFTEEFGPPARHDLDAAFSDYMNWLEAS